MMQFEDRREGGRKLAEKLQAYRGRDDVLVLALPRGGVPVAYEVARALDAPLDVFLVRKIGVPGQQELAMGAIASGGVQVLNDRVVSSLGISREAIDETAERERRELQRRMTAYRGDRPEPELEGRTVLLIDDGLATGATMRAAVRAVRQRDPSRVVVAAPSGSSDAAQALAADADDVVCVMTPEPYYAVGAWYRDFSQTTDDEVRELLADAGP